MKNINWVRKYIDKHYYVRYFITIGGYRVIRKDNNPSYALPINIFFNEVINELGYNDKDIKVVCLEWFNKGVSN